MFCFKPEEFAVEEITQDGVLLELDKQFALGDPEDAALERDYFTRFVLQKKEWNTLQALRALAERLYIKPKRFDFAGTKDRNAVTTQLCSVFALPPERLLSVRVKDLKINGAWKARGKVRLGDLSGNRFTITLTKKNCGIEPKAEKITAKLRENDFLIPNFFGSQRFGSVRENTARVGEFLVRKDFEGVVRNYLCFIDEKENEEAKEARRRLANENDFSKALDYFPQHLKYERSMLSHLALHPKDFVGAFQKLPRSLQLMFVHAFQSELFNELLEKRLAEGAKAGGAREADEGNVIGSESVLNDDERALLEKHGIAQKDFVFDKAMAWLSTKGSWRAFFVSLNNFKIMQREPLVLRFELPKGSYATVALDFLLR